MLLFLLSFEKGRVTVPAKWMHANICAEPFLKFAVARKHSFDFVVSNPDFEIGLQTIFIGMYLLKPQCKMAVLLPSDYFESSLARTRVYKLLDCTILKEIKVGKLAYHKNKSMEKMTADSIFILGHGRHRKYKYITDNARLAGKLKTKARP